jgi:RNA polymerase sigma factor (sigma-70 family)
MQTLTAQLSRQLSRLAESRKSRNDGELLSAFLSNRNEAAFAELVRRHGPLVWGACRRLLPDPADAEDAFQAAFLVLVRRARRLREQPAIGPWLHKVATWTARNIRRRNARTLARRVSLPPDVSGPNGHPAAADLQADLDGALLALPEKYRTPLILCHLQGWSRRDAAIRLGCPEGTLSSLLSRGLARLRAKLGSYDPAKLLSAAAVPAALASATIRAATASRLAAAGVVPASVSQLVEGVIHMFWVKKATAAMAAMVMVFGFGIGVGVSVQQVPMAAAGEGTLVLVPVGAEEKPEGSEISKLDIKKMEDDVTALRAELHQANVEAIRLQRTAARAEQDLLRAKKKGGEAEVARAKAKFDQATAACATHQRRVDELYTHLDGLQLRHSKAVHRLHLRQPDATEVNSAQPKPAPAKPDPSGPKDLKRQLEQLRAQIEKNQFDSRTLEAQREQLRAVQSLLIQKLKELERQQDLARNPKLFPPAAALVVKKESLLLAIGAKGMRWVFTVTEHDRDGKRTGMAQFDSVVPLGHYLAGAGKDAKVPKAIRITVAKDVQYTDLQEVLDLVKSAGMSVSSLQLSAAGQGGGDDALVPWEQLVRDREERDAARRTAESEALRQELDRLLKKLKQERLKKKPDPARP